jgi:hypothetical protein
MNIEMDREFNLKYGAIGWLEDGLLLGWVRFVYYDITGNLVENKFRVRSALTYCEYKPRPAWFKNEVRLVHDGGKGLKSYEDLLQKIEKCKLETLNTYSRNNRYLNNSIISLENLLSEYGKGWPFE